MAFKKYTANKDTTITNRFIGDKTEANRVTGSNTGQSDTLEIFSYHGRAEASLTAPSVELSRVLIEFPVSSISTDRTAGTIPASGSVSFILKMYDNPTAGIKATGYAIEALPLSGSWEEGFGIDNSNFEDLTNDNEGANWMRANGTSVSASATLVLAGGTNLASIHGQTFALVDSDGTSQTFTIDYGSSTTTGGTIGFGLGAGDEDQNDNAMTAIKTAINSITALDITASTITPVGDATSEHTLLVKQKTTGFAGNTSIDLSGVTGLSVSGSTAAFTGGSGTWANIGGGDIAIKNGSAVTGLSQTISTGSQDLEIDVSSFVEDWLASTYTNYGFLVKIVDSNEGLNLTASAVEIQNTVGVSGSFGTKKFYARTSNLQLKRPVIEAQWNDSKGDDRANFYYSSSLAPAADNMNTLYLNNKIRGRYADVPGLTANKMKVAFFTSSAGVPDTGNLTVRTGSSNVTSIDATKTETGIYSCSVAVPSGAYGTIYDVWYTGSSAPYTIFHRGEITPKAFSGDDYYANNKYILKVTNGKLHYNIGDSQRIQLYTRAKNITPNIFTVSQNTTDVTILPELYYRVVRTYDDLVVIPFGTGSTNHTKMSYDASGSYFDFDFSNLQADFEYKFEFAYYEDYASDYITHPYIFKFRTSE